MTTYEETPSTAWDHAESSLISSDRVTGTDVYNQQGDKLGSIDDLVIDKVSGQVRFVVMSFGGFLGIGEQYHQLPWEGLRYDQSKDGYVVNLTRAALEGAPTYDRDQIDSFDYSSKSHAIDDYYDHVDGFYSPEQQSRRNTDGVDADALNTNTSAAYRGAGIDGLRDADAVDSDLADTGTERAYRSGSSFATPRN